MLFKDPTARYISNLIIVIHHFPLTLDPKHHHSPTQKSKHVLQPCLAGVALQRRLQFPLAPLDGAPQCKTGEEQALEGPHERRADASFSGPANSMFGADSTTTCTCLQRKSPKRDSRQNEFSSHNRWVSPLWSEVLWLN